MNNTEYGFVFEPEYCIQCHACESACKNWRGTENGISWRRVITVESGSFPNTKVRYYSLGCMHCAEPSCVDACPVSAISKKESGAVVVDKDLCIACGACKAACPWDIPSFGADGLMQKCDMCEAVAATNQKAPCVKMCPAKALKLVKLSPEEKKSQEEMMLKAVK